MKHTEPYLIDELKARIDNFYGVGIDNVYGTDIPVLVEFEYDRDEGEPPQIRKMTVKAAQDWTLGTDDFELIVKQGADIAAMLTAQQETKIEAEMHKRYSAYAASENEAALEHEASQRKVERESP